MIEVLKNYAEDLTSLLSLDGEMAQFQYLIDIGQKSSSLAEEQKCNENKMSGCMAQVWIIQNQKDNQFYYEGDSDAAIVKGLVTIITEAMSGHTRDEIANIKHHAVDDLGLGTGLTARRQVGMMAMIDHIKKLSGAK